MKSSIHKIVVSLKRYLLLQRQYVVLSLSEKLTMMLSTLVVGLMVLALLLMSLLFVSIAVAVWLSDVLGSLVAGFAVVALFYVLLSFMIYANRKRWIADPIANLVASLMLGDGKRNDNKTEV